MPTARPLGDIPTLLRELKIEEASAELDRLLSEARSRSPEDVLFVAMAAARFQPIFGRTSDYAAALPFFETVEARAREALGPEHSVSLAAKKQLGSLYGNVGRYDDAARLLSEVYTRYQTKLPATHPEVQLLRDNLAIVHRNAGNHAAADALYAESGICSHLKPLEDYVRAKGARVVSVGSAWSRKSHVWVYFDVVLDVDALKDAVPLAGCVTIHSHRGTHDGAEQGFVCGEHDDGVMGRHPDVAFGARNVG